jgi:diacylglycerol kinase
MVMFRSLSKFGNALRGIRLAFSESHMRFHFIMLLIAVALGRVFEITPAEWAAVLIGGALVMCLEIMNTALESLADHLHPERHPAIRNVRDMAAGAVLFGELVAVVLGGVIFYPYFIKFF